MTVTTPELRQAHDFFAPIRLWSEPLSDHVRLALLDAPPVAMNQDSVFTTGAQGLVTCILAEEKVSADLQKTLDTQKQNLTDLCGVASAYVRKQAADTRNPDLVYDTGIWQEVFNNLPLMGESQFTQQTFSQSLRGVEIATSFLETIVGFAMGEGGTALKGFKDFMQTLGESIRLGTQKKDQKFSTSAITIVLETMRIGNDVQLVPMLKAYFIDFTQSHSEVYSNCASYESFQISFDYRVAQSVFNFGALATKEVADEFTSFIRGTQIDDIKRSKNFFGTPALPKKDGA